MSVTVAKNDKPKSEERTLLIRWVMFRSGMEAAEEYGVRASVDGISPSAVEEVGKRCFEYHSGIVVPEPHGAPAFLFWRTVASSEWILTRIGSDPELKAAGRREGIEYLSIVLTDDDVLSIGADPTQLMSPDVSELWEGIREEYQKGNRRPLSIAISRALFLPKSVAAEGKEVERDRELPDSLQSRMAVLEAASAVAQSVRRGELQPHQLLSFATHWPGDRPVPRRVFDLVVRGKAPNKPLDAFGVGELLTDTAKKLSVNIPSSTDAMLVSMAQGVLIGASQLSNDFSQTINDAKDLGASGWHTAMRDFAKRADGLAADVDTLTLRLLGGGTSEDSLAPLREASLDYLRAKSALPQIANPNMFAVSRDFVARRTQNSDTEPESLEATGTKRKKGVPVWVWIVGGVVLIGIIGGGIAYVSRGSKGKTTKSNSKVSKAKPPTASDVAPARLHFEIGAGSAASEGATLLGDKKSAIVESTEKFVRERTIDYLSHTNYKLVRNTAGEWNLSNEKNLYEASLRAGIAKACKTNLPATVTKAVGDDKWLALADKDILAAAERGYKTGFKEGLPVQLKKFPPVVPKADEVAPSPHGVPKPSVRRPQTSAKGKRRGTETTVNRKTPAPAKGKLDARQDKQNTKPETAAVPAAKSAGNKKGEEKPLEDASAMGREKKTEEGQPSQEKKPDPTPTPKPETGGLEKDGGKRKGVLDKG